MVYSFTNLDEESTEFVELQKIYQQLMKKKNQEQLYANFYSTAVSYTHLTLPTKLEV